MPKKKVDIVDKESGAKLATTEIEVDERGTPISKIPNPSTENPTDKTKEELEAELEHLKGTLEIISDKAYEEKVEALKSEFPESSEAIDELEPEELDAFERGLRSQKREKPQYMGKAGLVAGQRVERFGRKSGERGYNTYGEMMRDLRKQEKSSNPEVAENATRILNELFKKALKPTEKGKMRFPTEISGVPLEEQKEMLEQSKIKKIFYKNPRRPQKKEKGD